MSEAANTVPPSGLWKLRLIDLWKGFVKTAGGAISVLVFKLIANHFKMLTYAEIQPLIEVSAGFFLTYLGINAATNNVGELFTKDKPVVVIHKEKLEQLEEKAAEAK